MPKKATFLEGFRGLQRVLRGFQRLSFFIQRFSEIFQRFSEVLSQRGRFPSQRLSVLLPLIVLPLELAPIFETVLWKQYSALSYWVGASHKEDF